MKISVLINNYNYGRYLEYCIDSVLSQGRPVDEIIVYDDGSTDDSLEILRGYGSQLKVLANPNNGDAACFNQANSINHAFRRCEGDIICLLDSDDAFLPDKVEVIEAAFAAQGDIALVQHQFFEIDATNARTGVVRPRLKNVSAHRYIQRTNNIFGLFAQTSSLSFRRAYLEKVLPIIPDEFATVWPDVRLTRQSLFHGGYKTIRRPLAEYRIHESNDSAKLSDRTYYWNHVGQQYAFYNRAAKRMGFPEIDIEKSVNRPFDGKYRRMVGMLFSREPLIAKILLIAHEIEMVRRRIFRRTRIFLEAMIGKA